MRISFKAIVACAFLGAFLVGGSAQAAAAPVISVLNAQGSQAFVICGAFSIHGSGYPANAAGRFELTAETTMLRSVAITTDASGTFTFTANTHDFPLNSRTYAAGATTRSFVGVSDFSANFYMTCTPPTITIRQQSVVTNQVCGQVTLQGDNFSAITPVIVQIKANATGQIIYTPSYRVAGATFKIDWATPAGITNSDNTIAVRDYGGSLIVSAPLLIRCGTTAPTSTLSTRPAPATTAASAGPSAATPATPTSSAPTTQASSQPSSQPTLVDAATAWASSNAAALIVPLTMVAALGAIGFSVARRR